MTTLSLTLNNTRLSAKNSNDIIRELKNPEYQPAAYREDFYKIFYDSKTGG
jgi:hypothetical protein